MSPQLVTASAPPRISHISYIWHTVVRSHSVWHADERPLIQILGNFHIFEERCVLLSEAKKRFGLVHHSSYIRVTLTRLLHGGFHPCCSGRSGAKWVTLITLRPPQSVLTREREGGRGRDKNNYNLYLTHDVRPIQEFRKRKCWRRSSASLFTRLLFSPF